MIWGSVIFVNKTRMICMQTGPFVTICKIIYAVHMMS